MWWNGRFALCMCIWQIWTNCMISVMSTWTKICQECFQHPVKSITRGKAVLKAKGGPTGCKVYLIKLLLSVYQSGNSYKAISKALGLQRTTVKTISKWKKAWHSSEPFQNWPTLQNSSKSIATTHPASHKWPKNNNKETVDLFYIK